MAAKSTKSKKGTQRKLTAILSADVAGYSRLMGDDEEATIETLTTYRKVFTSEIKKHRGRVVDAKGDAILAEFASVVDAVSGAVEIQRELAGKNASLPDDRRMDFRIGINMGDVVVKDGVIYGDGVNVAARLEALAEPGGICISRSAYDQVESKLNLNCEYLGEQQVKNIAKPVRAYRVLPEMGDAKHRAVQAKRAGERSSPDGSGKPSIAVLPFQNMSGDPEQEFFGDGLVEDILTSLSAVSSMTVIARNSTFAYKGKAVDVREVAKDLGVRYVLEGSVRRSGSRLRITAQLIDSIGGSHLWAEKYDRIVDDIFDIQDEITKEIVTALRVNLSDGETALLLNRGTSNVQAWGYCVQAWDLFQKHNPADSARARELAEKAVSLDPDYATAWAILGLTHLYSARGAFTGEAREEISRAAALEEKALALDDSDGVVLGLSTMVQLSLRNFERSVASGKRGISLYPGSSLKRASYGMVLVHSGEAQASIRMVKDAMRLNPRHPLWYNTVLARALDCAGHSEEALEENAAILDKQSNYFPAYLHRAVIFSREGRLEEAKEAVAGVQRTNPNFRLAHVPDYLIMRNQEYVDAFAEALRKAGLPD